MEPTKQYTKSQNKYAPKTKQLKIKGVKYPNEQSNLGVASLMLLIILINNHACHEKFEK